MKRDPGRRARGDSAPTAQSVSTSRREFEELALRHLQALFRFASRLTGGRGEAEDLVQDTYLKALKSFATLRDRERVKPWLFKILSRLATDRFRKTQREVAMDSVEDLESPSLYDLIWEEDPLPYSDHLHDDFLARFRDEEVRAAVRSLPEVYRVPLVLLYAEDMSYRDLSEILDCPVGTVMSRLHRGRKILERELWECARRRGLVKT